MLFLFTVGMFFVFSILWIFTVPFDKNRKIIHGASRFWSKGIYWVCPWWKVEVSGLENIEKGKSYIVVSNHQAMLDIPLLYTLPFNFKWVSKKEVYRIPIFGWVLWMHGDVAISRGDRASTMKMMEECGDYLQRGVSVILFPEGTRTKTGRIGNFKEGAMLLARKTGASVLPVVIDGTYDAFGKGGITAPHRFQVKVLPPLAPEHVAATKTKELRDELHGSMSQTHQQMMPTRYAEEMNE